MEVAPMGEETEAQRREQEQARAESAERRRRSHIVGVLGERAKHEREGNAVGIADCDEALRGLQYDPQRDTPDRPDPAQEHAHHEAAQRDAAAGLNEARGIRTELLRHRCEGHDEDVLHAETEMRRALNLPADADVDDPALWPEEPAAPTSGKRRSRGRFGRGAKGPVINDPVLEKRRAERVAEGKNPDYEDSIL